MAGPLTLAWVDEVVPDIVQHGDWENPNERVEFHDERLSMPMRNHLLRTLGTDGEGEHYCQSVGCQPREFRAPTVVGYHLISDYDGGGESLVWEWTTVIEFPDGRILLVCEECTPTNFYPEV